jgi:hypothetical protein
MSEFKRVETVEHPQHYNQGNIECIDAMLAAFGPAEVISFCKLNAFKYIWRAEDKLNTLEDLKKAAWYINKTLELYDKEHK